MTYTYTPSGVCSRQMFIELDEDNRITDIQIKGGCSGNSQGVIALAKGRTALEVRDLLRGIRCGDKNTSCPDQLAAALDWIAEDQKGD